MIHDWDIALMQCRTCSVTKEQVFNGERDDVCTPAHKALNERAFRRLARTHLAEITALMGRLLRLKSAPTPKPSTDMDTTKKIFVSPEVARQLRTWM